MDYSGDLLRHRVTILTLEAHGAGWGWRGVRETWAGTEESAARSLFSAVGIGARTVKLTLRRQPLTLDQAILWGGRHLFLTEMTEPERGWLEVHAALVELVACAADFDLGAEGLRFPGVLTEKYLRHEQLEPMAVNLLCYVLVTPKQIVLHHGSLVDAGGALYEVLLAHTLDPYKNEYEILRRGEP